MPKVLALLILSLIPWVSFAQGKTLEQTRVLHNAALIDRLSLVLEDRLNLLSKCSDETFNDKALALTKEIKQSDLYNPQVVSKQYSHLLSLLTTLRQSKQIEKKCLGTSEIKSIRQAFKFSENTENRENPLNRLWWKTVAPSCYKIRLQGTLGKVDSN